MFGECAAVYVDPGLITSEGMKVEGTCDQFFSRASLSDDEHGGVVVRHALDHLQ